MDTSTHVVCDRPDGLSGKALGNVLGSTGTTGIDADVMNVLKTALYLLRCESYGVLTTSQILFKLLRRIQFEAVV